MCGIILATSSSGIEEIIPSLKSALSSLDHRGPDNASYLHDQNVFLGHTRLAIIDLDSASNQPFSYENLSLIYNGEVFNYIEIRDDLKNKGYIFETDSDTEVVLKAFHCFGTDCFNLFNGMWALAIHDKKNNEIIISRDRFGQKSLFYSLINDKLVFASELHAIALVHRSKPNYRAIKSFLQEGTFDVGGETFFEGIYEFPCANFMRCKGEQIIDCQRYWVYPEKTKDSPLTDETFHQLLDDAVKVRLRTDVDYCLLLSGGIDSTLVAGITQKFVGNKKHLSAFTYSSKDKDDEALYAQVVANELNIEINISSTLEKSHDYLTLLKSLVKLLGRGHSSPAIISSYFLYKSVSEHGFKVALDGQGADELLAGYKHYHLHLIWEYLRRGKLTQIVPLLYDLKKEGIKDVIIMVLRNSLPTWGRRVLRMMYGYESVFSNKHKIEKKSNSYDSYLPPPKSYSAFDRYLHKQHTAGLLNLLYYGDIVAMANSVENRSPFMDHRLVELAFKAGSLSKVRLANNKSVLRTHPVYMRFKHVLDRKKVGFNSPIDIQTRLRMIEELRKSKILDWPIFNPTKIREYLGDDRLVGNKYERFLFRLIQVHYWSELFTSENEASSVLVSTTKVY